MLEHVRVVQPSPFNAETRLENLSEGMIPVDKFFVRCNFGIPSVDAANWQLCLRGGTNGDVNLSLDDLMRIPQIERVVLFECAGNGRSRMRPIPTGVAWDIGAVGWTTFRGPRLTDVLAFAGVPDATTEIAFKGVDTGNVGGNMIHFERSLPFEVAMRDDVIIALEMGGAPLTPAHGFPARLVVPGWYGIASVKWLDEISFLDAPFTGYFQTERYVFQEDPIEADGAPVTLTRVRSVITNPAHAAELHAGPCEISGFAWSGSGEILDVMVSCDGGIQWNAAELRRGGEKYGATAWSYKTSLPPGTHEIMARARDAIAEQPVMPVYNRLGYANNGVHTVSVRVE